MSLENVEIARSIYADTNGDLAALARDDALWAAWVERVEPYLHADFEGRLFTGLGEESAFSDLAGLRSAGLDWLAAVATYRREVEKAIDCGDRVLLLVREYARLYGSDAEVTLSVGHIFTFRAGMIIRWETFQNRAEALRAVGLEE